MVINTVEEKRSAIQDSYYIRHAAQQARLTIWPTLAGARAASIGMQHMAELAVYDVQVASPEWRTSCKLYQIAVALGRRLLTAACSFGCENRRFFYDQRFR